MFRTRVIAVLWVVALAALVAPAAVSAATLEVDEKFDVSPGQELRLAFDRMRGDIVVEGWDKNVVEVTGHIRGRDWEEDDELEIDHSSGGVDMAPSYRPHNDDRVSVDLKVMVPRKFDVLVRAAADTRLEGIEGDVVVSIANASVDLVDVHGHGDVSAANGKIRMKKCTLTGDISSVNGGMAIDDSDITGEVDTVNGSMEVSRAPEGLNVSSVNGNVEVGTANGRVEVKTTNGRIRIKELGGAISAETVNGAVRFRMVGDASGDRSVDIETLNGSVEIEVPEDFSMDFDVEVKNEDRGDHYEIISDFDLDIESEDSRRGRRRIRGKGKIGGGKNTVHIRATNGDVILKRISGTQ